MIAAGTFGSDGYGHNVDLNLLPDKPGWCSSKNNNIRTSHRKS